MTTMLLLLVSVALVGTGVGLIWRDVNGRGRNASGWSHDSTAASVTAPGPSTASLPSAISVTQPEPARPVDREPSRNLAARLLRLAAGGLSGSGNADGGPARPRANAGPAPATALEWAALQPVISTAVDQVNGVVSGAGVAIGPPGDSSLSASGAYGCGRCILVGGESLAWLRLECAAGRLFASVKAQQDGAVEINNEARAALPDLSAARVSDLLSECLKPVVAYAVRTKPDAAQRASETAWNGTESLVVAALKAGNGALSQAGARLVPLATPAWDAELRHHRMPLAVQVFGEDIARMHIDLLDREIEVAVGLPAAHLASLGRRERIAVDGMTIHALAELISGCAWPAIARYRETRGAA